MTSPDWSSAAPTASCPPLDGCSMTHKLLTVPVSSCGHVHLSQKMFKARSQLKENVLCDLCSYPTTTDFLFSLMLCFLTVKTDWAKDMMGCLLRLLLLLLLLLIRNSNSGSPASSVSLTVHSGEAVQLSAKLTKDERDRLSDLRWQNSQWQLNLRNKSQGEGGRYQLLPDGSLSFSRVETRDSGIYTMRVFDKDGTRIKTQDIRLVVKSGNQRNSNSNNNNAAVVGLAICCFLLLSFIVSYFIVKRRRRRRAEQSRIEAQENVYVEMRPSVQKEEELYCALYNNTGSTDSPIAQQDSPHGRGTSA